MSIPKINFSDFSKILKSKILIVVLIFVAIIGIFVISNIISANKRKKVAEDFGNELPVNLDEIFDDAARMSPVPTAEEQKEIDMLFQNAGTNQVSSESRDTKMDNINAPINIDMTNILSESMSKRTKTNTDNKYLSNTAYAENVIEVNNVQESVYSDAKPILEEEPKKPTVSKKAAITSFIIDSRIATKEKPTFITLTMKVPSEEAVYFKVKVYARKLNKQNEPVTRQLIFALPKIYIINGHSQTQFYWGGRTFMSQKYVAKGRYILYAEVEAFNKKHERVGVAGRYSMPKFENVVTLK